MTAKDTHDGTSPERLVLYGVTWAEYSRILRTFAERPSLRVTYDRGNLELMKPPLEHNSIVRFFSLVILALTLELGLPLKGGGCMTFRRRRCRRGLQPDQCYWIGNESQVRGIHEIDLRRDPPPDLALEVISYSTLDRMKIYAALRMPEVWRYKGSALTFYVLGPDGRYATVIQSRALPQVASAELTGLLVLHGSMDETALFQHFQAWARQRFGHSGP